MHELDVPVVVAIERSAYQFPWSEGIFRDCLRVGYVCRLIEVGPEIGGYGIMSIGAGEAHILNVCVREDYRCRGLARQMLLYLLERARMAGMFEAFLEVRPSNIIAARLLSSHQWPRGCGRAAAPFAVGFMSGLPTPRMATPAAHAPVAAPLAT
jgi:ribosomal-protein-alanine N-acetyltransferase